MIRTSFVLLHYGDREVTAQCINSILGMEGEIQIIIVDNDAEKTQEFREKLKKYFENIICKEENGSANVELHVIQMRENTGFSKANNCGFLYARDSFHPDYIVVCNNDIVFTQKEFPVYIDRIYRETQYAVMGPDVIHQGTKEHQNPLDERVRTQKEAEYTIRMNHIGLRLFPVVYPALKRQEELMRERSLREKMQHTERYEKRQEGMVLFGACLIFSKKFLEQNQAAFEPETQFYYEEYILALRCKAKGYKMIYDPQIKVLHECGSATKKKHGAVAQQMKFRMKMTEESCRVYLKLLKEQ